MKGILLIMFVLSLSTCIATGFSEAKDPARSNDVQKNPAKSGYRLPLELGWFLPEENKCSCDDILVGECNGFSYPASAEGMITYTGQSLNSSPDVICKITSVTNGGNVYEITQKCRGEGKMEGVKSVDHTKMIIKSSTSFIIEEGGHSQSYTWRCGLPK